MRMALGSAGSYCAAVSQGLLYLGLLLSCLPWGQLEAEERITGQESMNMLERGVELGLHESLLRAKARPGSTLTDFASDGCSGGLSSGWSYLVTVIPGAREVHGELPPWEFCCVEHDRAYHTGAVQASNAFDSFEARDEADLALASCVSKTGLERAPYLAQQYGLSEGQIISLYETISALMYQAVRIGGVPCSGLSWRWGHGWPPCE